MFNRDQKITPPPVERKTGNIRIDLPTTPEIARFGVGEYIRVATIFPRGIIRNAFLENLDIRTLFVGTTPEITLIGQTDRSRYAGVALPLEHIAEFEEFIKQGSDNFIVTPWITLDSNRDLGSHMISEHLVNKKAALHVIRSNPTYFPPDAQDNLEKWLTTQRLSEDMYGLLSGFPVWNLAPFRMRSDILDRMKGKMKHEDARFWNAYLFGRVDRAAEAQQRMGKLYETIIPDLTEEEKTLLVKAKRISRKGHVEFVGFDVEKDQQFVEMVTAIYEESGIDQIAENLKK